VGGQLLIQIKTLRHRLPFHKDEVSESMKFQMGVRSCERMRGSAKLAVHRTDSRII
jgi:hypothetical protein